jgi:hypothetical protein
MPVYAKKVQSTDARFSGRSSIIMGADFNESIPVPDSEVLCNGCNENIYPNAGYLVYLGKRELKADQPYDIYCESCLKKYFKGYKEVNNDNSEV